MAFDFPITPTVSDIYAPPGGPSYTWDGVAWVATPAPVTAPPLADYVLKAGDFMTGALTLPVANPTAAAQAAHKAYVDTKIGDAPSDGTPYVRQDAAWVLDPTATGAFLPLAGGSMTGNILWSPNSFPVVDYNMQVTLNKDPNYRTGIGATTAGKLNFVIENTGNEFEFFIGGVLKYQVHNGGIYVPPGCGLSFADQTVSAAHDYSKHIRLYTNFGFTVTPSQLNYGVASNTQTHKFWGSTEGFALINGAGLSPLMGGFNMPSESEEIAAFAPQAVGSIDDEGKTRRAYRLDQVLEAAVARIKQLEASVAALQAKMKVITDLT